MMDDDFANDKEILRQREEQAEYEEMVRKVIETISFKLRLRQLDEAEDIDSFHMSAGLAEYDILDVYGSDNERADIKLMVLEYEHYIHQGKRGRVGGVDEYLFGLLNLRKEFPATIIYPETLKEKIADIFINQECEFPEQKRFCRRFYVLTEDKERLRTLLITKSLDELADIRQLEIELRGSKCLFRVGRKSIAKDQADRFCKAAIILNKVFN